MLKNLRFFSAIFFIAFLALSFFIAKDYWQQLDFDTTAKLQNNASTQYDKLLSYFSYLGSAEIIIGLIVILVILSLVKKQSWVSLGWLLIIPASVIEIIGKLNIVHPGPPAFFHRSVIETDLPSFYIHTTYSYPSGHMTRTIFLVTILVLLLALSKQTQLKKIIGVLSLVGLGVAMALTRVYLGEHWLSDVVGGIFLGGSFGTLAAILMIRRKLD